MDPTLMKHEREGELLRHYQLVLETVDGVYSLLDFVVSTYLMDLVPTP